MKKVSGHFRRLVSIFDKITQILALIDDVPWSVLQEIEKLKKIIEQELPFSLLEEFSLDTKRKWAVVTQSFEDRKLKEIVKQLVQCSFNF